MENIIAVIAVAVFLAGILLVAKKFLKPPKGLLPDCCGPRGNRGVQTGLLCNAKTSCEAPAMDGGRFLLLLHIHPYRK
jgi:hypothetical protein